MYRTLDRFSIDLQWHAKAASRTASGAAVTPRAEGDARRSAPGCLQAAVNGDWDITIAPVLQVNAAICFQRTLSDSLKDFGVIAHVVSIFVRL